MLPVWVMRSFRRLLLNLRFGLSSDNCVPSMTTVSAWWSSRSRTAEVMVLSLLKMEAHCLEGFVGRQNDGAPTAQKPDQYMAAM